MKQALSLGTAVVLLIGCTSAGVSTSDQGWKERLLQNAREPGVMAQFCVLETKTQGHLNVSNVLREHGQPRSIGSTLTRFLGTSSSGQYLFQGYLGKVDELFAVIVFPVSPEQQVFVTSKSMYSVEAWSQWVAPDLVSTDRDIQFKLLYGKNIPPEGRSPMKALARFKVGSYVQWRAETDGIGKANLKSDLDPCPLTPNPSIERDVQGLAPLAAPHVKR